MSKLVLALVGLVSAAGVAATALVRLKDEPGESALNIPATAAKRAPPAAEVAEGDRGLIGILFAHEQVVVSAKPPGRILSVNVRVGDLVKKGQSLATIEAAALERELAAARASLRAAEADVAKARVEVAQTTDR